jgi:ubiquinone/menaquinone biosynthesis C-methylase UbiE
MKKIKYLNKLNSVVLLVLCFLLYYSNDIYSIFISYKEKNRIKGWFNTAALNHDPENLHYGSSWNYLTAEKFKEIVLDSVAKMEPKINKHEKIFELGVGVGAALKVIETDIGVDQLEVGGSDIAENAISEVKKNFPKQSGHFFVWDMTQKHNSIPDNYYDHVFSFGALAMYLTKDEMKKAIKEAVRITKPGGSLLFAHFIAPGAKPIGSIICPVEQSFFEENAKEWGIENIKIYKMKNQGDRYGVTFQKKS